MANQLLSGFVNLADLAANRVTSVNQNVISTAIDTTLAEHNRQLSALLGLFVQPVTDYQLNYKSGTARSLQALDQHGRPLPTKSGARYTVAYPIHMGGDAFGYDWVTRAKMTVQEVNDLIADMLAADKRWMRDRILAALYTNVTYSFTDPIHGALTVQPLANADGTLYQTMSGADAGADDTHHYGQAAAIADATNPYPTLYTELSEHPENSGPFIAFIPTGLRATTEALATFYDADDPDLTVGANTTTLTGTLGVPVPGTVIGKASQMWVVEWPSLPAGYIIGVAAGGPKPLAMREDPEPELRGFKRVADEQSFPWYESVYVRRAGFGAYNRVGAAVVEISDASYDIPTGYTAPL
jgi:hypothetical protein